MISFQKICCLHDNVEVRGYKNTEFNEFNMSVSEIEKSLHGLMYQ